MANEHYQIAHISIHQISKSKDKSTTVKYNLRTGDTSEVNTAVLYSGVIETPPLGLSHAIFNDILVDIINHSKLLICGVGPKTVSWTDQTVYVYDFSSTPGKRTPVHANIVSSVPQKKLLN